MRLLLGILIFLASLCQVYATTYTVGTGPADTTSCTAFAVQTAVNAAAAGDSVYLNCARGTWTSYVTVTRGITIYGNGQTSTVLAGSSSCLFSVTLGTGADFRIHDIGFTGTGGGCGGLETQLIRLSGTGMGSSWGQSGTIWNTLRADHLTFTNTNQHAITIDPWWNIPSSPKALFDHITFSSNQWSRLLKIAGSNLTWQAADNYGTDDAVFVEDSTFTWTGGANGDVMDTEHGTRMVVRYNTITNGDIQMHDTGSTSGARGQRITEVYNNTISCTGASQCVSMAGMGLRGGGYIVHDNSITGNFYTAAWREVWRSAGESHTDYMGYACNGTANRACNTETLLHCSGGAHAACSGNWDCTGSSSGACVAACTSNSDCPTGVDGTSTCLANIDNVNGGSDPSGYPCRDQTGWGQEYGTGGRYQYPSPVYWYNNTGLSPTLSEGAYLVQDRDYCYHDPSTTCGSKAGWTYTAYTYPHPLQAGVGMLPPKNLRVGP